MPLISNKTINTDNILILLSIIIIVLLLYVITIFSGINQGAYTKIITLTNVVLVIVTMIGVGLSLRSNHRAERIFTGQNKPLVDITPIGIGQSAEKQIVTVYFTAINYSGFKAFNIGIDVKFGHDWIREWLKAKKESENKNNPNSKGVEPDKLYKSMPKPIINELEPGETLVAETESGEDKIAINAMAISGTLDLEKDICSKGNEGYPVLVRTTWTNSDHHIFDEVHKFRLICTDDGGRDSKGIGRAFTFIPEGKTSQKEI